MVTNMTISCTKFIRKHFLIIFIFILLLFSFSGCSYNEYKSITINNELGSYSFEYPSSYEKNIWDNLEFRIPYTNLVLEGTVKSEEVEVFDPDTGKIKTVTGERGTCTIHVTISNYKIENGESYSANDVVKDLLQGEANWSNFKLLGHSQIIVSGVQGEFVEYLVDRLMPIPVEDGKNLDYISAVFFDYNNYTWGIRAKCNQDMMKQVKADFDHIIQTFKIIE
jgi:hypothetical protein